MPEPTQILSQAEDLIKISFRGSLKIFSCLSSHNGMVSFKFQQITFPITSEACSVDDLSLEMHVDNEAVCFINYRFVEIGSMPIQPLGGA